MKGTTVPLRAAIGLTCALAACANGSSAEPGEAARDRCVAAGEPRALADLPESSGVALSRRTAGLLWSLNDSGQPVLVAFDRTGTIRGRVRIPNATVEDWEDVTSAPCASGNCLYIADIGDNARSRAQITVYRIPEPEPGDAQSTEAEVFTARYPDGAHDAEALFVSGEDLFIVTKAAAATLYRFPTLRSGAVLTLERVTTLPLDRVTDAEASSDGTWVAVRTNDDLVLYRASELVRGAATGETVSLRALDEPQGEGVALDGSGMVYLTSEGGGGTRAGRLTTLRCALGG